MSFCVTYLNKITLKCVPDDLNADEFTDEHVEVSAADFARAIKGVKPSISEVDLLYFEKLRRELTADPS